jgi:signal transduction histidine kinase
MLIWALASTIVAVILLLILITYRRQIKKICRQLTFFKSHSSNIRITYDTSFKELNQLTAEINNTIDKIAKIRITTENNQETVKNTIINLSHDIRTPLTSLNGYFQLLAESDSKEDRDRYLHIIQNRIDSLKDMLEELFTYAKFQSADYVLETEQIDFSKCIYETLFSFYDDFKEKGIEPEINLTDERISIIANKEALTRAIQNVIKNVLLHGDNKIRVTHRINNSYTELIISNEVKSTNNIQIENVFDRFYTGDKARTSPSTGLGLSIAKDLIESMNGTVTANLDNNIFSVIMTFPIV